jgi:YVTN family beta-propeller protein
MAESTAARSISTAFVAIARRDFQPDVLNLCGVCSANPAGGRSTPYGRDMPGLRTLPMILVTGVAASLSGACATATHSPAIATHPPSTAPAASGAASPTDHRVHVTVGGGPKDVTYAAGSLWVTNFNDSTVSRVDPVAGRVVATIPVGQGPITAVATGDGIWIANYLGGSVSRIDPATDEVTVTVAAGGKPVGLTADGAVLWVFNQADATATLIDTRTAKRVAIVATGVAAGWSTAYNGRIWVSDFQGGTKLVVAIDPARRRVVTRVSTGAAPIAVSFADGSGWVANTGDATVTRFDPATGRGQATIPVPGGDIGPLLATPDAIWVSIYGGAGIAHIDPSTNAVVATIQVGVHPQRMAVVGSSLWLVEDGEDDIVAVTQP